MRTKIPTLKRSKQVSKTVDRAKTEHILCFSFFLSKDQDESTLASLGEDSNAIVWPRPILDEDEEVDPVEAPDNQRLMRIGPSFQRLVVNLYL